jgi:hypothetical protein
LGIFEIDFSGVKDARKKIWIAKGVTEGEDPVIEDRLKARDLANSGKDIKTSLATPRQ